MDGNGVGIIARQTADRRGNGVYHSADQAETWMPVNAGLIATRVTALTVTEKGRVLVSGTRGQLFSSADEGRTWTLARVPMTFATTFAVDADGCVLAAGSGETPLLRSCDGGETWTPLKTTGTELARFFLSLALSAEGYLYLGAEFGIYRSMDNGETWTALLENAAGAPRIQALLITPTGDIFAGFDEGLYRSTDRGATWERIGLQDDIQSIVMTAEGHLIAGGDRLHRSTDQGASWQVVYEWARESRVQVETLVLDAAGNILAGTSADGIYRSTDGGETWQPVNKGLSDDEVNALAVHPETGRLFAGTGTSGVFRSNPRTPVSVEPFADDVPEDVRLLRNYPNPFRAATTIEFALPEATHVRLVVYDGLGREVAVLVDAPMRPGVFRVPVGAAGWPSGVYGYRLETAMHTRSRMMALVR